MKTCLVFVSHMSYSPQLGFSPLLQSRQVLSSHHATFLFLWKLPEILLHLHPLNPYVLQQKAPRIFTQIFWEPRMSFSPQPFILSLCSGSRPPASSYDQAHHLGSFPPLSPRRSCSLKILLSVPR